MICLSTRAAQQLAPSARGVDLGSDNFLLQILMVNPCAELINNSVVASQAQQGMLVLLLLALSRCDVPLDCKCSGM